MVSTTFIKTFSIKETPLCFANIPRHCIVVRDPMFPMELVSFGITASIIVNWVGNACQSHPMWLSFIGWYHIYLGFQCYALEPKSDLIVSSSKPTLCCGVRHHPIDQGRRWRLALADPSPTNKTQKVQLLEGHKNLIFMRDFYTHHR